MTDIPEKPRRGRPPGSKNKKTLERERLADLEKAAEVNEDEPSPSEASTEAPPDGAPPEAEPEVPEVVPEPPKPKARAKRAREARAPTPEPPALDPKPPLKRKAPSAAPEPPEAKPRAKRAPRPRAARVDTDSRVAPVAPASALVAPVAPMTYGEALANFLQQTQAIRQQEKRNRYDSFFRP